MTSQTFDRVVRLVARGEVVVSEHGYDELAADGILIRDILAGVRQGKVIEGYPEYYRGPCVLVLQRDQEGNPVHVVWGIPSEAVSPAVVVTALSRPCPVDRRFLEEKAMTRRRGTKFVHEGEYVAAVEVEWLESETGWSPYLSWQDAQRLDDVREALRRRDLKAAGQLARIYQLTPVSL